MNSAATCAREALTAEEKQAQAEAGQEKNATQVVVEGQRERAAPFSTANLDLTRTEDDALPFQVFDARDIELSGATHLHEFWPDWDGLLTRTMYVAGGNPDLKPETTDSINIGLILTPRWIPGLRLSVDYLESTREDAIFAFSTSRAGVQDAINLESELPGIVERGPPDASGVGVITRVDLRQTNLRQIASRSLDFTVEQRLRQLSVRTLNWRNRSPGGFALL